MLEMLLDWKDHNKALSNKLWEFLKEEYLVDFNVTCHGQHIKVHKFVLAFLFPVLKESLRSKKTSSFEEEPATEVKVGTAMPPTPECLDLDNIAGHHEDMDYLIEFAYKGKTTVPKEHVSCLVHIADNMGLNRLKESLNQWHGRIHQFENMEEMLLESKDHDKTMSNKLWEFFKEEYLVDFNVTCHGYQKKVHKFVLAFLFPMLKESLGSATDSVPDREDLPRNEKIGKSILPTPLCLNMVNIVNHAEDMDYLIQFAYTGKATVPKDHAECLLHIADTMEIPSLKDSLNRRNIKKRLSECNDKTEPTSTTLRWLRSRTHLRNATLTEQSMDSYGSIGGVVEEEYDSDNVEFSDSCDKRTIRSRKNRIPQKLRKKDDRTKEQKRMKSDQSCNSAEKPTKIDSEGEETLNEQITPTDDKGKKSLKCPQCDYTAKFPYIIERHLKYHAKQQIKGPKLFPCKICKEAFETKKLMDAHRDSKCGSEPLVCKYCGHKTSRKFILLQHMISIHQVDAEGNQLEKNIQCPDCDFVCCADYQLRAHTRGKHERSGKFKCKECNYAAPYITLLVRHERVVHQDVRNYMCEECGYRFTTKARLNEHILVRHKGVKPHRCHICNAEYVNTVHFKIHLQRHESENEFKFVCQICGLNLMKKGQLRIHMRKKHGMKMEELTKTVVDCNPCQSEAT